MYWDVLLYWYGFEKFCLFGCELYLCLFISVDLNFCLQDVYLIEGFGQVCFSMDIIDQLMVFIFGNMNLEVVVFVLSF